MSEPMTCGGWAGPTVGCGAPLRAERYGRDPAVDHDTMIRCLDCGTPMCPRCARDHFKEHVQQLKDRVVVDALHDLEDEDHLACEQRYRGDPCDVCVSCVARLKYQQACARVGQKT